MGYFRFSRFSKVRLSPIAMQHIYTMRRNADQIYGTCQLNFDCKNVTIMVSTVPAFGTTERLCVCVHLCTKELKHSINCYFGVFDNIIYSDFRLIDVVILRPIEKYHLNGRSAGAHKRLATQNNIHSPNTHEHT